MNKTVLITGGSRGIGAQTVRKLTTEGYRVAFLYEQSEELAQTLSHQTGAMAIKCDISKSEDIEKAFSTAKIFMGIKGFDALVCNAGISRIGLFDAMDAKEWAHLMDVNLNGNVSVARQLLPYMISQKKGSIVTVSSMWGQVGASCEVGYSTSKAALIGFTKSLAKEVGPSGIRVNCVAPGVIDTDMNRELTDDVISELTEEIPLGRIGRTEEVAEAISFLISEKASYITGQILGINGGIVC